jgi:hypothetical protein
MKTILIRPRHHHKQSIESVLHVRQIFIDPPSRSHRDKHKSESWDLRPQFSPYWIFSCRGGMRSKCLSSLHEGSETQPKEFSCIDDIAPYFSSWPCGEKIDVRDAECLMTATEDRTWSPASEHPVTHNSATNWIFQDSRLKAPPFPAPPTERLAVILHLTIYCLARLQAPPVLC